MNKLIYLATPYSHIDKNIEELRYEQAVEFLAHFMNRGYYIFSPIAHCHVAATQYGLPKDWQYWQNYCVATLSRCQELWVLMMDGWKESVGVQAEIKLAEEAGITVRYLEPHYQNEIS